MPAPSLIPRKNDNKKDRIDLRLYNTIVIFDVYVAARSSEAARECVLAAIADGSAQPTEAVAKEITAANSIRSSWANQSPYVASDITEEEFESLKGISTAGAFERFYLKR